MLFKMLLTIGLGHHARADSGRAEIAAVRKSRARQTAVRDSPALGCRAIGPSRLKRTPEDPKRFARDEGSVKGPEIFLIFPFIRRWPPQYQWCQEDL